MNEAAESELVEVGDLGQEEWNDYAIAQGWFHVASGMFDTALVVCEEKMSS